MRFWKNNCTNKLWLCNCGFQKLKTPINFANEFNPDITKLTSKHIFQNMITVIMCTGQKFKQNKKEYSRSQVGFPVVVPSIQFFSWLFSVGTSCWVLAQCVARSNADELINVKYKLSYKLLSTIDLFYNTSVFLSVDKQYLRNIVLVK